MSNVTRLKDPHNCVEDRKRLKKLQEKISVAMTKLFRDPKKGGNPFLFSLIAPKEHELAITLPGLGMPFTTAATDGKKSAVSLTASMGQLIVWHWLAPLLQPFLQTGFSIFCRLAIRGCIKQRLKPAQNTAARSLKSRI